MAIKSTRKSPSPTPSPEERNARTKKEIVCAIIKRKTKEKFSCYDFSPIGRLRRFGNGRNGKIRRNLLCNQIFAEVSRNFPSRQCRKY